MLSDIRLPMVRCVAFALLLLGFGARCQNQSTPNPNYFLSVMVMERNQISILLEFVRHYLEEGVDHFFLYNVHNTPNLHTELDCIDPKYFTIIPHMANLTSSSKVRQAVYDRIRRKTEWLALVDSDDYISSRATPEQTMRQVLDSGIHAFCEVVTVPTINYAWGDTKETPVNKVRATLTHRWGYDHQYEYNASSKPDSHKFSDAYDRARNKIVVRTRRVERVRTNIAYLEAPGYVCVATERRQQACVHHYVKVTSRAEGGSSGGANSRTDPEAAERTENAVLTPPPDLPRYCPPSNVYMSRRSSSALYLLEEDIPGLSLACHHYRIPSWQEWERRAGQSPQQYKEQDVALANRLDVRDDYMQRRAESRRGHPQQLRANAALAKCDQADPGSSPAPPDNSAKEQPAPQPEAPHAEAPLAGIDATQQPPQGKPQPQRMPDGSLLGSAWRMFFRLFGFV